MTPTLPDDADTWAHTWRERLNESASFADAADGFEADLLFAIRPDDRFDGDPARLLVEVVDGECAGARAVETADYDYALRGPYGAWKALLRGELDVTAAVLDGPFDVEGNTVALVSHREAFVEMVRTARGIDVEFAH